MVKKPLGQLLMEMDLISESEIQEAIKVQKEHGGAIGKILVDLGYITEQDMNFALSAQLGMDMVDLDEAEIEPEVIMLVPQNLAEGYRVIPVSLEDGVLTVALADPLNIQVLDELSFFLTGVKIQGAVSSEEAVQRALEKYYGTASDDSMESILGEMGSDDDVALLDDRQEIDPNSLQEAANSAPIVKLLNLILLQAIKARASDVHLEPFEKEFKVRYRVDGVLYEMMPPRASLAPAIISRVKVMSKLDIAETRMPQDGRIELTIGGSPVDLRISTLPTMHGESVVMRILDRGNVSLDLDKVGMREDELTLMKALLGKPHGIILVTGPTGSGKTTTLYSALAYTNSPDMKIITTEDPVEYNLDGIIQVPINEEIGVTYAACLRSILRQDPDVIFVGEIRDLETAQIAIEASLTGHLVLSTLHTNDAPSTVTRLVDLGVEPFLIAATLEAVVAQRLVRRICAECRTEYQPTEEEIYQLDLSPADIEGRTFWYGRGCKACNNSGYRGRTGLFEIMVATDDIRQQIVKESSATVIRDLARRHGMRSLRESGLLVIFEGKTTIEEVVKETILTS